MPTDIVIVSAARTPIATAWQGFAGWRDANTCPGRPRRRRRAPGIDAGDFEDIGFGESMQGGGNVGRYAANQPGLTNVPAVATSAGLRHGWHPADRRQHQWRA